MGIFGSGLQAEILGKVLKNHMEKNGITLITVQIKNDKLDFGQYNTQQIVIEEEKLKAFLNKKNIDSENKHQEDETDI
jgi:hypothetical protein